MNQPRQIAENQRHAEIHPVHQQAGIRVQPHWTIGQSRSAGPRRPRVPVPLTLGFQQSPRRMRLSRRSRPHRATESDATGYKRQPGPSPNPGPGRLLPGQSQQPQKPHTSGQPGVAEPLSATGRSGLDQQAPGAVAPPAERAPTRALAVLPVWTEDQASRRRWQDFCSPLRKRKPVPQRHSSASIERSRPGSQRSRPSGDRGGDCVRGQAIVRNRGQSDGRHRSGPV